MGGGFLLVLMLGLVDIEMIEMTKEERAGFVAS